MSNPKSSADFLISVATVPLLVAIATTRAATDLIRTLGEASEEIFRGDRLPILKVTASEADQPTEQN